MAKSVTLSPLDIMLDSKNPRFIIPPDASQDSLRLYLLEYEEVESLMRNINVYKGLMPGERIIVTTENGHYVALEGNRRVCACQMLLNPDLVPHGKSVPKIDPEIINNIMQIEVDVVENREAAHTILSARHIDGVRDWLPLSKRKFYANLFEGGKPIFEIKAIAREQKVKTELQEYYLIKRALDLPIWTVEERGKYFNLQTIGIHLFIRIFNTRGAKATIGLEYDSKTLQPKTQIPAAQFDRVLEYVMRKAYITNEIDTRTPFEQIEPDILTLIGGSPAIKAVEKDLPDNSNKAGKQDIKATDDKQDSTLPKVLNEPEKNISQNREPEKDIKPVQAPPIFFENLQCNISTKDSIGSGILAISKEIIGISKTVYFKNYPIATAMLLRTLLEQTLKYHLKKTGHWDKVVNKGFDPSLDKLIKYFSQNLSGLIPDATMQRIYKAIFDNVGTKESLDLIVHHTDLVTANKDALESIAKGGLKAFIEYLLTYNHVT